jgi:hypothetical protein
MQAMKNIKNEKEMKEKIVSNIIKELAIEGNQYAIIKGKLTKKKLENSADEIVLSYKTFLSELSKNSNNGLAIASLIELYTAIDIIVKEVLYLDKSAKENNLEFDKKELFERLIDCENIDVWINESTASTPVESDNKMYR